MLYILTKLFKYGGLRGKIQILFKQCARGTFTDTLLTETVPNYFLFYSIFTEHLTNYRPSNSGLCFTRASR